MFTHIFTVMCNILLHDIKYSLTEQMVKLSYVISLQGFSSNLKRYILDEYTEISFVANW